MVRIESQADELKGYGEAPHIEDALRLAAEDVKAGGLPYGEVYGKLTPHYLTGTHDRSSKLDTFCKNGNLNARFESGTFVVDLIGWDECKTPQAIRDAALEAGRDIHWVDPRGSVWLICPFTDGSGWVSRVNVSHPPGTSASVKRGLWRTIQTGKAASLLEALPLALADQPVIYEEHVNY